MARGWSYRPGDWNAICDSCGKKLKASELKKRWDGLMVCADDFEHRHPQDFIKPRSDKIYVPWSRPQSTDSFDAFEYPTDVLLVEETIGTVAEFIRTIGGVNYGSLDADVLNGSILNLNVLNYSSVDPTPPTPEEVMTLSEDVVLVRESYIDISSDTATISEAVALAEGKALDDSLTFGESVNAFLVSNKILNAHLANEVTLG